MSNTVAPGVILTTIHGRANRPESLEARRHGAYSEPANTASLPSPSGPMPR